MKYHIGSAIWAVVAVLANPPVQAQVGDIGSDLGGLASRYGVEVTTRREGDAEVTELRPGGVLIREVRRNGSGFQSFREDESGHGAVLCPSALYIHLRGGLDVCALGKYPGLPRRLDEAISAMNAFIVANNAVRVTPTQVEAEVAGMDGFARARASVTPWCSSGGLEQWAARLALVPRTEWERSINDILSVPRPPVVEPCPSLAAFLGFTQSAEAQSHGPVVR